MGRMYVASGSLASWTAAGDIVELSAPSTAIVILHSLSLMQSTSETDDSCSLILARVGSSGSGGSPTPTANPLQLGDSAFGGTLEQGNTTDSTGNTTLFTWGWSIAGFEKIWTPDTRPIISPSGSLVLSTGSALAVALTLEWSLVFEEIGT